ncbi:MAG TPA: amino acid permease, partial [Terriglobales bacterium]|nr:amino acid permease [Terriglobales bacterium]
FGFLAFVNYIGVRSGTVLSNLFTVVKLLTLFGFIAAGVAFLVVRNHALIISAPRGPTTNWLHSILLLIFAYGGYETALFPGGEATDPRRDYPFALFVALIACTIVYTMAQWLVISIVPMAQMTNRPIASAVEMIMGPTGAAVVSVAILFSTYGFLSANILGFPRILFALAEQGDVPSVMAKVHPRFRTPHIAIVALSACALAVSLAGSFQWNITISAIARLIYYGSVCAALPVFRRKQNAPPALFRLPLGNLFAVIALCISAMLFPKLDKASLVVMGVVALCIVANMVWAKFIHERSAIS